MSATRSRIAVACGLCLSFLAGPGLRAQDVPAMAPWAADALDAGCLLRDELAALGGGVHVGSQAIVRTLGMERGEEVVRCLLALPAWRDHVSSLNAGVNGASSLRFRVQARPGVAGSGGSGQAGVLARWRGPRGMQGRLNASTSETLPALGCRLPRDVGDVLIGTLSPRIGQGVSLWSSGAFDDLGGLEGSHRMGSFEPAASRARGHIDGVGWMGNRTHGRDAVLWALAGRIWQGHGWTAAVGGGRRTGRAGWLFRLVPVAPGLWRSLLGGHGGFESSGWSVRWGAAAFRGGVSARCSILRSWTAKWEGFLTAGVEDPDHPALHSGERRATVPDPQALSGRFFTAGLQWKGAVSGWWRTRWEDAVSPVREPRQRSALRLAGNGHRLTVLVDASTPWNAGREWQWAVRYRREWQAGEAHSLALRLGASGEEGRSGGVVGIHVRMEDRRGGRWRFGVAQAWGHAEAPTRYITGWDRLPAQAFRDRDAHLFLRHSRPGRPIQWAVRLNVRDREVDTGPRFAPAPVHSWWGVEFRPQTRRTGRLARAYIGRAESGPPSSRRIQTQQGHGHDFRHQEWTLHPPPGWAVPGD